MELLLKAIRERLTNDATLTAIAAANDITSSYNAELANYPCAVLSIKSGGSRDNIPGITEAVVVIDIYSAINKLQCWTIAARIKTLLHNNQRDITTADRLIHAIEEQSVTDLEFDKANRVWRITQSFKILYSESGVTVFSIEDGVIYANATDVTAIPADKIADFKGLVTVDISFRNILRSEQERFAKSVYYNGGLASITISEVNFIPASVDLLWDITYNASGTLADDSTPATTYTVTQASIPNYLQFLMQGTKSDDGKLLEIEADKVVCESLRLPISTSTLSVHQCRFLCLGDANDIIVRFSVEN